MTGKNATHQMNDLLEAFGEWLFNTSRASQTIESYKTDIKLYHAYLDERVTDNDQLLSRFLFVKYKDYLMKQDYKINTVNKKINSLKVYSDFLNEKGIIEEQSTPIIALNRDRIKIAAGSTLNAVDVFSDHKVEKLLFYVEDTSVSIRNKLIVYLLLYCGIRVSELTSILVRDVNLIEHTLIVQGKGKVREISLRHDVAEIIKEYMKTERAASRFSDSEYLLISERGERINCDEVRNLLKQISNKLGFPIYPHRFRRTLVTNLIRTGVPIPTVSAITGSSIQVLEKHYISTSREDKQRALDLL